MRNTSHTCAAPRFARSAPRSAGRRCRLAGGTSDIAARRAAGPAGPKGFRGRPPTLGGGLSHT
eukprot:14729574-Alexandrium_andersonii.AAC.1